MSRICTTKTTGGCAMAQAVLRRPFTAEARVPSRPPYVGYPLDRVAPGKGFSPCTHVCTCHLFRQFLILIYSHIADAL